MLDKFNTRQFHWRLYSGVGMLESVDLFVRGDDQDQGTVTKHRIHGVRRSRIQKRGQTHAKDMSSDHATEFHIPRVELDRVGVAYINAGDYIIDGQGRRWQPEGGVIEVKLMQNHVDVACRRANRPTDAITGPS